jgi:hypothetical protein
MSLEPTPENSQLAGALSDDLGQYEVPSKSSSPHYVANSAEEPRNLSRSVSAPHSTCSDVKRADHGSLDSEYRNR